MSIMHKALLECINISKPQINLYMANFILGKKSKLLEYQNLIANQKMRPTWIQSYGNEIGCLARGMPGCMKGADTIFLFPHNMASKELAKDATYGLITCLVRPGKND